MNLRRTAAALAGSVAVILALVAVAQPASAGLPVLALASVDIPYNDFGFSVCVSGHVDDGTEITGEWVIEIAGARSDATLIQPPPEEFSGPAINPPCIGIAKLAPAGHFHVTVWFAGAGTSDFIAVAAGAVTWNPLTSPSVTSGGI